jgi:ribosomal protein S19E (S16A)
MTGKKELLQLAERLDRIASKRGPVYAGTKEWDFKRAAGLLRGVTKAETKAVTYWRLKTAYGALRKHERRQS